MLPAGALAPVRLRGGEPDTTLLCSAPMTDKPEVLPDDPRQGPLQPIGHDGLVVVENPPAKPMHMTPDEADISGIRMLDAAHRARTPDDKPE